MTAASIPLEVRSTEDQRKHLNPILKSPEEPGSAKTRAEGHELIDKVDRRFCFFRPRTVNIEFTVWTCNSSQNAGLDEGK